MSDTSDDRTLAGTRIGFEVIADAAAAEAAPVAGDVPVAAPRLLGGASPPVASDAGTELERLRKLYEAGATIAQLADMTETAISTLSRRLRRCGARMRSRGAPAHVRAEDVRRWREAYEAGDSLKSVAASAGVCFQTVRHHLRLAGVKIRHPGVKVHKKPSRHAAVLPDWRAKYDAGASLGRLAAEYGVHRYTVQYALERAGTKIRKRRSDLAGKPVAAWAAAFRAGESPAAIGRRWSVSEATVRRWLHKQGVQTAAARRTRVTAALAQRWAEQRRAGAAIGRIARAHRVHPKTVTRHLRRQGVATGRPGLSAEALSA